MPNSSDFSYKSQNKCPNFLCNPKSNDLIHFGSNLLSLKSVSKLFKHCVFPLIVQDPVARSAFAFNTKWCLIPTIIGLVTCPLPVYMKSDLIYLLSALSHSSTIASEVWCALVESRLFAFIDPSPSAGLHLSSRGILGLHVR